MDTDRLSFSSSAVESDARLSFVVVSRFQELRDESVAQGQRQVGTIRGAVQRPVPVDTMHGAQQDDAPAASWRHRQVCRRRQGTRRTDTTCCF